MRRPLVLETHRNITVVRDDLLPGGSKTRFLGHLIRGAEEVVYGAPFCGGAPLALAHLGAELGIKVTLFYAARSILHKRQVAARALGATLRFERPGYMSVVQARAREYAKQRGALFLPLGFDTSKAEAPFVEFMRKQVRAKVGDPTEVWCATGSGMLARCLGLAFPDSEIKAVTVGLASRHGKQLFTPNVTLLDAALKFEQESRATSPFPSCPNYDLKAWEALVATNPYRSGRRVLFWNVLA